MLFAFPVIVLPHVMTEVVRGFGDDLVNFAAAGGVTTAVCVIARILRRRPRQRQRQQQASSPAASCLNTTWQSAQFRPLTRR